MAEIGPQPSRRVLDPIDRYAEILFGLIMVLTFTGSLSASRSGHEEIHTMLIGAIGCNLAWGIIDAVMYLMTRFGERGRDLVALRALRISNAIAIAMLFVLGFLLGRHAGHHPWRVGISMVGIGALLVGITVALGG